MLKNSPHVFAAARILERTLRVARLDKLTPAGEWVEHPAGEEVALYSRAGLLVAVVRLAPWPGPTRAQVLVVGEFIEPVELRAEVPFAPGFEAFFQQTEEVAP